MWQVFHRWDFFLLQTFRAVSFLQAHPLRHLHTSLPSSSPKLDVLSSLFNLSFCGVTSSPSDSNFLLRCSLRELSCLRFFGGAFFVAAASGDFLFPPFLSFFVFSVDFFSAAFLGGLACLVSLTETVNKTFWYEAERKITYKRAFFLLRR